jgi:hypothetical protein
VFVFRDDDCASAVVSEDKSQLRCAAHQFWLNDVLREREHVLPFPVERMLAGNSFVSHTITLDFKVP